MSTPSSSSVETVGKTVKTTDEQEWGKTETNDKASSTELGRPKNRTARVASLAGVATRPNSVLAPAYDGSA